MCPAALSTGPTQARMAIQILLQNGATARGTETTRATRTTACCFDGPARCHHGVSGSANPAHGCGSRDASRRRARSRQAAGLPPAPGRPMAGQHTVGRRTAPGRPTGATAAGRVRARRMGACRTGVRQAAAPRAAGLRVAGLRVAGLRAEACLAAELRVAACPAAGRKAGRLGGRRLATITGCLTADASLRRRTACTGHRHQVRKGRLPRRIPTAAGTAALLIRTAAAGTLRRLILTSAGIGRRRSRTGGIGRARLRGRPAMT